MMEFFSMCMVINLYTGVQLIYLESVDESVGFYKKLGYQLVDPRKSPEAYQEYGNDTSEIPFPMLIKTTVLNDMGHTPYSSNTLQHRLKFNTEEKEVDDNIQIIYFLFLKLS